MATVAYDGDSDTERGNLFTGKSFFIQQRVPSRQKWVNLVKANAGQIVRLEQQADILIADHAKNHCPPGSISWKYIQDSVRAGELKDPKDYPAGPATHIPRPVGSSQHTKKSRTPFTAEDDRILTDWVLEAARSGGPTRGNELFKKLELANNRHTFQSWRDRWIKYLSRRFPPNPEDGLLETPPDQPRPAAGGDLSGQMSALQPEVPNERVLSPQRRVEPSGQARPQISPLSATQATRALHHATPGSIARPNVRDAKSYAMKSPGGSEFTNEEIESLFEAATDIMNVDEDLTIDAWIAWANNYPSHTAQEWRNCFAEVVAPRISETTNKQVEKPTSSGRKPKRVSTAIPISTPSDKESNEHAADLNVSLSANEAPGSQPATQDADQLIIGEEEFKKELAGIAKGLNITLDLCPVITGRAVPLYRLWKIVRSDEFGGFDEVTRNRLWARVARKLNFNDFQHSNAAKDLESCYRNILLVFDAGQEAYDAIELSESQEQQMIESQLRKTAARETQNPAEDFVEDEMERGSRESVDDLHMRLPMNSGKRSFSSIHTNQASSSQAWPSSKRQRIGIGKGKELEIPSTPERVVESDQLPHSSQIASQPKDAFLMDSEEEEEDEEGSEAELPVRQFKQVNRLPTPSAPVVRPTVEPQTQDFHFPLEQYDETESVTSIPSPPPRKTRNESQRPAPLSRPSRDTSAQSQTEAQPTPELDLGSFISHYTSLGYSLPQVIEALEATTMNTGNAGVVMEDLRSGNGIPKNIQGVWTSSDDEAVEENGHPRFEDVLKKHGQTRAAERRRFLVDQKAAREKLKSG